jgi:hypothetical protein
MAPQAQRDPAGLTAGAARRSTTAGAAAAPGSTESAGPGDARRALLAGLIDHAALFPPAELPMDAALDVDARARETPEAWILNRFIVPASQLDRIPGDFAPPLSVVLDVAELPDLAGRRVELVEARLARLEAVRDAPARVFLEVWPGDDDQLRAVAEAGAGGKVRCGGPTPDMFPSPAQLAAFITGCRDAGLAFKATAGLHHPIRDGIMHGFLNLLAAALFAQVEGAAERDLVPVLREEDENAFKLTPKAFTFRGRPFHADEIAATRERLFIGYGSCSFSEPVDDLRSLGML